MKLFTKMFFVSIMFFSTLAIAEEESTVIKTGTGGTTGSYFKMGNDIKSYCGKSLDNGTLEIISTGGSVDNVLGMASKKFSVVFTQEDVLQYFAKKDPKEYNNNRQKIISGLHIETAHLLIPNGYTPKNESASIFSSLFSKIGFGGGEKPQGISLDLLKNQQIGSWGGSVVSTKALSFFMDLNLDIVDIPEANRKDPGMPVLLVGGQPYAPVEDILATGKYMLVPINFDQLSAKAPFYLRASANYKIGGKLISTPTFAVRAFLVGKSFRNEDKNKNMVNLAKCISDNLADLADDPNTSPNWQTVYEMEKDGEQSNWSYFPIK